MARPLSDQGIRDNLRIICDALNLMYRWCGKNIPKTKKYAGIETEIERARVRAFKSLRKLERHSDYVFPYVEKTLSEFYVFSGRTKCWFSDDLKNQMLTSALAELCEFLNTRILMNQVDGSQVVDFKVESENSKINSGK